MATKARYVTDLDNPKRKILVMNSESPVWQRRANEMARSYCNIRSCKRCGHPVHERYCCGTCGETDPTGR